MKTLQKKLQSLLAGKLAIVGMGNIVKGDDGAGPRLVQELQGTVTAALFDAGTSPENQLGPIIRAKPQTVLLVDALHFDQPPGSISIFSAEDFITCAFTTHTMNLEFFVTYLRENGIGNIVFLGIQPGPVDFSEGVSPPVRKALGELEKIFHWIGL